MLAGSEDFGGFHSWSSYRLARSPNFRLNFTGRKKEHRKILKKEKEEHNLKNNPRPGEKLSEKNSFGRKVETKKCYTLN